MLTVTQLSAQQLDVMTYNIRLDVASDGIDAWPIRSEALNNQIGFLEPDVFGLQEALPHQVTFIDSALFAYDFVGEGRDGNNQGEASPIFYKRDRFTLVHSGMFWLSLKPDTPSFGWGAHYRRVCTYARLRENQTGTEFLVFNTHMDHEMVEAREKGLALIVERMKAINQDNLPVLLFGDFNAEPDAKALEVLQNDFRDAATSNQGPHTGPYGTFTGFDASRVLEEKDQRRIDYIFVSRNPAVYVMKYGVLTGMQNGRYLSDHLPVMASVLLSNR